MLQEIVDLIKSEGHNIDYIEHNIIYDTVSTAYRDGKLVGFARFNVENDIAFIVDCIVSKEYRHHGVLRELIESGVRKFPFLKVLVWERDKEGKPTKYYELDKVLRRTDYGKL
jgi:hypothetical protein